MEIEALRARRKNRRRVARRRRLTALLTLVAAALAVAIVLIASVANRSSHAKATVSSASSGSQARSHQTAASGPSGTAAQAGAPSGRPGTRPVPILMYHVIAQAPPAAPFPGLYVTPNEFAAQMQALKNTGWHTVTLDQLAAYWRDGASLGPGKPIVLSFDNGYQSQYTQALPVLRRLGWVGDENIQLTGLPPAQGGLGPSQVRGLVSAGWELDTQGISHADLITLDAEALHDQVAVARHELQQRYHVPVNWFCYPSGHYDATVVASVKAAGYEGSTTVVPGWAHRDDDPYRLHRLRVLGGTTPQALLAQIEGARAAAPAPASYSG